MIKNKNWFSIIIAIWLVVISSLLALTILEYMVPFSRDVVWVENSTLAYYNANSWVEVWLYFLNNRADDELKNSSNKWYSSQRTDFKFDSYVSSNNIPEFWKWSTWISSNDWNKISIWNPIQLSIWYNYITAPRDFNITFRVPDLDNDFFPDTLETSVLWTWYWLINWQISGNWETLNSDPSSMITIWDINWQNISNIFDSGVSWTLVDWTSLDFQNFYTTNCVTNECILKFSIVNSIVTDAWATSPFLEWQISSISSIPLRYFRIESEGISYWYTKNITVRVPQNTVSEAFDFTVFQ